jgi:DNA-binding CsgD family transcriptional regulator
VDDAARALVNLATTLAEQREYRTAAAATDRALDYALAQDLDGYVQYLYGVRAEIRFEACDWDGALADVGMALARPARTGVVVVPALVARGRIEAARGHPDALSTLDEAARQADRTGELQRVGPVAVARAEYFAWHADLARSAAEAERALTLARTGRQPFVLGVIAFRLWRAGATVAEADIEAAAVPYRRMIRGEWAEAAAEWERRGARYTRLTALALGDTTAAAEALRTLDDLGATRAAQRLRADLRRRGLSRVPRGPRPSTAANLAGLTARQLEVLTLLGEGLSNAEIADRLTLSGKTVDHHVSALLGKLGVATRGQAAALFRRHSAPR